MNIMVTGANGGYGSQAIDYLQRFAPEANIYGLVRSEGKGVELKEKGINVRIGDYSDVDSMVKALKGIDRLLFVSSPIPGIQKNVVDAAKINNVQYIAYTSIFQPEHSKFGLEINHKQTEKWINESGIPHTFLRNSWYMEINQALFDYAKETQTFPYFSKNGQLSFALKREYAEAGAQVISNGNYGEIINLAGDPKTYSQLALATQTALNEKLDIKETSMNDFIHYMDQANIPTKLSMITEGYQEYTSKGNNGESQADSSEFEKVLGHPLTNLPVAIQELLNIK
ncbi:NAD(P)H-binding protein [Companilactobacillus kimchiensis]|uniref:YtfG protein n=1 Tax=Companilactobacillus kimchiensis TaxID=993692 RepID=A0A0R2LFA6_9LACO|nr:NAD(P)H-binding protein [Companilactobacillus kimchiensis]KRO00584.1 YtfG protein [Companilactobacillus kimchiensis]